MKQPDADVRRPVSVISIHQYNWYMFNEHWLAIVSKCIKQFCHAATPQVALLETPTTGTRQYIFPHSYAL